MTCAKFALTLTAVVALVGCTNKSSSSNSSSDGSCANATISPGSITTTTSTNSIPVYVADPGTTGAVGYTNEPLVSVTICTPNHTSGSQCQTISNVLLDTGSYGLRLFASAITSNVNLSQVNVTVQGSTYPLGQCEVFGSGADWGSVKTADVILGSQTASNIPIQVIDYNYAVMPTACQNLQPDTDPCHAGFNGIIGVGVFAQDCGTDCNSTNTSVNPGNYFACTGSQCFNAYNGACSGGVCAIAVGLSSQVINPITQFATNFNNGLALTMPAVSTNGSSAVQGTLTFGINSTAGDAPGSSVVVYASDASGMTDGNGMDFRTVYNSTTYGGAGSTQSFLDSGSNGIFFPGGGSLTLCSGSQFYCPATTQNLSATIEGYLGAPTVSVNFSIANTDTLSSTGHTAFNNLGGQQTTIFDWGLPFFFGHTVFVGFDGQAATYNSGPATGPYWAF